MSGHRLEEEKQKKDEKTEVKERSGSMRVPISLVTTLETIEFGRQGMSIRGERAVRNGKVVFRAHGKCGQEDVGAMHDQPRDDRLVEVFTSNAPCAEHEPVLKVLPGTQDLSSRGRVQKRRRRVTWCELATMEGVGWQEEPRRVDQHG